jgi:hypothetical protein
MAASSIHPEHWTKAQKALEASTSLEKLLQLADRDKSLVDLNELDSAWPGAFAAVRRHQEEIVSTESAAPKR